MGFKVGLLLFLFFPKDSKCDPFLRSALGDCNKIKCRFASHLPACTRLASSPAPVQYQYVECCLVAGSGRARVHARHLATRRHFILLQSLRTATQKFVTSFEAGRRASKERVRGRTTIQPPRRLGAGAISSRRDIASAADRPKLVINFWVAVLSVESRRQGLHSSGSSLR